MIDYRQKNRGSILIYTLLILGAVIVISIVLFRILIPKFHIVRGVIYSTTALYAADSGMEWCIYSNRMNPASVIIPPQFSGLTTIPGVDIRYYTANTPTTCPYNDPINFRTVGTYRGISRSLEIFQ